MQTHPNRLWITVLALGWTFDLLFWGRSPGVQFAIYAVLTLAAGAALLTWEGVRPARASLILLPFILCFALLTFVRTEPMTVFLARSFTLFLMAGLTVTYAGGRWIHYGVSDYLAKGLQLTGSLIALPIQFAGEAPKAPPEEGGSTAKRAIWPIVRGLLLAVPVVALFAALLSSADAVFAQRVNDLSALFKLENFPEYIFRAILIAVIAYALAGIYLHAARKSAGEKLLGIDRPVVSPFMGFIEAAVVLGSVVLLFAAFGAIQFQYFFGGRANIAIEGFTYAEYARRGFGELVAVAFFSLLLFLGLSAIVRRESDSQRSIFSGLGLALVALVGIVLASAFQRLMLYEAAYGFTRLRTYTHVFMIWLGLLLAAVVVLDLLKRQRAFALAALAASVGFALTLGLLNTDAFIVRQNVQRTLRGEALDAGYLASLSADAIPPMVAEFHSAGLPPATREAVGAALACIRIRADSTGSDEHSDWRSFTLPDWQAQSALQSVGTELKAYRVIDADWTNRVAAPGGTEYDCWSSTFD